MVCKLRRTGKLLCVWRGENFPRQERHELQIIFVSSESEDCIIEGCVRGMSKVRRAPRWERSSGETGVGHRGGEEGFLGQEMGRRAGEACGEGGPARTHPRKEGRGQHCRAID